MFKIWKIIKNVIREKQDLENRKYFRYAKGKSKFSEHVLKEGHEMKTIEETMSIIHLENNHRKINTLEEIEVFWNGVHLDDEEMEELEIRGCRTL